MKPIIVVDLDGTMANGQHRLHLLPPIELRGVDSAWEPFNMAAADDLPIQDTIELINVLHNSHYIVILTGRGAVAKDITEEWLTANDVHYDKLIMRAVGDCRADIVIKEDELRKLGLEDILCCFDDLAHVVQHIRSLGLTCYHVTSYAPDDVYAHANHKQGVK